MTAKQLSDINLELFRVFYQVARTGSMTQAAKVLFITQPAISHAVSLMEERLGVKLFERSGRRLVLTAEGRLVQESASRIFAELARSSRELRELQNFRRGVVRIGGPFLLFPTFLTQCLSDFHRRFPGIRFRLEIENRMARMLELIRSKKVDLLFLATPQMTELDPDLAEDTLGTYRYCFGASRDHFGEIEGRPLTLPELNCLPVVILRPGNNTRDFLEQRFAEKGERLNVQFETETMALTDEFTRAGLGIGAMIRPDTPGLGGFPADLFEVRVTDGLGCGRYVVLHRRDEELPGPALEFLKLVRKTLAPRASGDREARRPPAR